MPEDQSTTDDPAASGPGSLTAAQRKSLKARARNLHPVVWIGDKGLTDAVLHEVETALKSHELIKLHVAGADRDDREAMLQAICTRLSALPVQHIGRILVIYREQPEAARADTQTHPERPAPRGWPQGGARVQDERLRRLGRGASAPRSAAATRVRPRGRTG